MYRRQTCRVVCWGTKGDDPAPPGPCYIEAGGNDLLNILIWEHFHVYS